ncbi:MAG: hypothetical protein JXR76_31155 [Deltaproteobacteria bacterium]|nr:hypothetical protein [Deltaproteobacteria bacterium]
MNIEEKKKWRTPDSVVYLNPVVFLLATIGYFIVAMGIGDSPMLVPFVFLTLLCFPAFIGIGVMQFIFGLWGTYKKKEPKPAYSRHLYSAAAVALIGIVLKVSIANGVVISV